MGKMTKNEIVALLAEKNPDRLDQCVQYADAFLEYVEATDNIESNGTIVQHPRTMNPIVNPYTAIRDKALKKLQTFYQVDAVGLWES